MLLQPPKIKDSVMGQPESLAIAEEAPQLVPVALTKFEAIDDDHSFAHNTAELNKPKLVSFWLQLERLSVEAERNSCVEF